MNFLNSILLVKVVRAIVKEQSFIGVVKEQPFIGVVKNRRSSYNLLISYNFSFSTS